MKKLFVFVFIILPLLAGVAIAGIVATGIETRPLVDNFAAPDARSIARGKTLVEKYRASLLEPEKQSTLVANESDINQMLSLAGRGLRIATLQARVDPKIFMVAASVRLPKTPLGEYFNASIGFIPSEAGIRVAAARIGRVEIPGWLVVAAMSRGLDLALGKVGAGSEAVASVKRVTFASDSVRLTYQPTPQLIAELQEKATEAYREFAVNVDPATVRAYYANLVATERAAPGRSSTSLTRYLGPLLALAQQRSASNDPGEENAAAIVALAIYFGDSRFEQMIGAVRTGELAGHSAKTGHVRLRGRHDLVQHFTISAALAVTTGQGIADVIGELKEVQDTGKGGSGFSFTDIAADRAGTRFAELATSGGSSKRIQGLLAGSPAESMFFPSIEGLPEFMPADQFRRRFGNVGSPEYQSMISEIDQRINSLAAYRGQ